MMPDNKPDETPREFPQHNPHPMGPGVNVPPQTPVADGGKKMENPVRHANDGDLDRVDEASDESFPASDAPSHNMPPKPAYKPKH